MAENILQTDFRFTVEYDEMNKDECEEVGGIFYEMEELVKSYCKKFNRNYSFGEVLITHGYTQKK